MLCIKCRADIPDGSKFCNLCGAAQTKKPRKRMRGNGDGGVYKMPNGKWRAVVTIGFDVVDGKLHQIRKTKSGFEKKQDARDWVANYAPEIRERAADRHNPGITLRQLYEEWFPTHRAGASTMDNYKYGFRVFDEVADFPMEEQDIDDLQECLDSCGKGRRTRENAKAALGLVYKYGIPRNCVPKDRNLAQYLIINADGEARGEGLNDLELGKIKKAAEAGDQMAQIIYCHCYLGFRPTAFLELTKADYNPEQKTLTGGIKTAAGRGRTVTISPKIQPYIDRLYQRPGDYLFTSHGKRQHRKDYSVPFYSTLEKCGIHNPTDEDGRHRLTPHSCRHTFATLMKRVSGSDKDKLALIGHTSTEQLRHYQDVHLDDLRNITNAL